MFKSTKHVAFFGATGNCAGYCLAAALNNGYSCVVLARTPSKLITSMKNKGVSKEALDTYLKIIEGNAKDLSAVKRTLQIDGQVVDTIISGLGGTPLMQWGVITPLTITDPTICQDTTRTLLQAAKELTEELNVDKKPLLVNILSPALYDEGMPRDVPVPLLWLYHWILRVMLADKKMAQDLLREHVQLPESEQGISGYVIPRPSLLLDGRGKGIDSVREGPDERPAIGYFIQKEDVGNWMFDRFLKSKLKPEYWNNGVNVTS